MSEAPLKVWFACTGVGVFNRGIETFFREAFDHLHPLMPAHGIHAELFKGGGADVLPDEHRVWCLPRTGGPAMQLAKLIHRSPYVVEQLSFLPGFIRRIRAGRPDVIFHSDGNMAMRLWHWRKKMGVPFKLLYSNGAPLHPPFTRVDHVQQVVPCYYDEAMAAGEPAARHSSVPYGFDVPPGPPPTDAELKASARRELGLPLDRPIVISVGWIDRTLKRMDYTVSEIALMQEPRPYLVMLGAIDADSRSIIEMAREKLGENHFRATSVPPDQVSRYYQAADVFVLASLNEGFGRVYVEALIHGLPVVAHDGPVTRFVLDGQGVLADLSVAGGVSAALGKLLQTPDDPRAIERRRESVRERFAWEKLAPAYAAMFKAAAGLGGRQ